MVIEATFEFSAAELKKQLLITFYYRAAIAMQTPLQYQPDSLLLCQSCHLREAAILASCLASDNNPPFLLVLDPPPLPPARYRQLENAHHATFSWGREVGPRSGKGADAFTLWFPPLKRAEIVTVRKRRRAILSQMASFDLWLRRLWQYAQIVESLNLKRAVCLFLPNDSYFEGLQIMENELFHSDRLRVLLQLPTTIFFLPDNLSASLRYKPQFRDNVRSYRSLPELCEHARDLIGIEGHCPAVEVSLESSRSFVTTLLTAFANRAQLKPVAGCEDTRASDGVAVAGEKDSDQVVLVEDTGQADMIHASLYAYLTRAKLLVTARPKTEEILKHIEEYDKGETKRRKAASEIHRKAWSVEEVQHLSPELQSALQESREYIAQGPEFHAAEKKGPLLNCSIEALERFSTKWSRRMLIRKLENIAASEIHPRIIEEVGERWLTAFTHDFPYNFVPGWHAKPIGHVTFDWGLPVYREVIIFPEGALESRSSAPLSLVFDPGYFRNSPETNAVSKVLESAGHPFILAQKSLASWAVIANLASIFPLEFIHLNTHGNQIATLFERNFPITVAELPRWFHLSSAPLVFNNSCQSWRTIARAFLNAGARGYIGTMWSVPVRTAAIVAESVPRRMVGDGLPSAIAVTSTDIDGRERGYIFLGTVNTRFTKQPRAHERALPRLWIPAFALALLAKECFTQMAPKNFILECYTSAEEAYRRYADELLRTEKQDPAGQLAIRSVMMGALQQMLDGVRLRQEERKKYRSKGTMMLEELQQLAPAALTEQSLREFTDQFVSKWGEFLRSF